MFCSVPFRISWQLIILERARPWKKLGTSKWVSTLQRRGKRGFWSTEPKDHRETSTRLSRYAIVVHFKNWFFSLNKRNIVSSSLFYYVLDSEIVCFSVYLYSMHAGRHSRTTVHAYVEGLHGMTKLVKLTNLHVQQEKRTKMISG